MYLDSFDIFSVYEQIYSAYSENMHSEIYWKIYLILSILLIWTDSFCVFCVCTDLFHVFDKYAQIIFNI